MHDPGRATTVHSLARFLESFFSERNIRWMLLTGVLLLVGSSLMLVTRHWDEIAPVWKSFAILGYTAAAFGGGRLAYFRLGLRSTGTVLLALSVLLIPIDFLALHWLEAKWGWWVVLFAANLAFAWPAARSVFSHFLRSEQPTFLASYITLAAAGALAPLLPGGLAPWAALALWGVFTAGAVKASRRVFWLGEEHRLPRIFGFFPIGLLGAQYLAIFLLHFRERIEPQWIGLGCALVAIPVLLTAHAVLRVFESRTGGIVRPLPPSVLLPLGAGILLSTAGLCLASVNLFAPERDALALVPAAAIVAGLMGLTARRTSKTAFVWAMLAAITIAYNSSPVFFRDLAASVVSWGASAVREPNLPYAFYGLTYLPLIVAASLAADAFARRGENLFRRPLHAYAIGLACIFLAASATPTQPKALFPVAGAIAIFLAWRAGRLRASPRAHAAFTLLAIGAWTASLAGAAAFAGAVTRVDLPPGTTLLTIAAGTMPLLAPRRSLHRIAGAAIAAGLAIFCLAAFWSGQAGAVQWLAAGAIAAFLAASALQRTVPGIAEAAILFPPAIVSSQLWHRGASWLALLEAGTLVALLIWAAAALLERYPRRPPAAAFAGPARRVSGALLAAALGFLLPLLLRETAGHGLQESIAGSRLGIAASAAVTLWALDAARRFALPGVFYYPAALCAMGLAGAVAAAHSPFERLEGVALVWVAGGLAALPILFSLARTHRWLVAAGAELRDLALPGARFRHATRILGGLFAVVSVLSFFSPLSWPMRIAGVAALAGLFAVASFRAPAFRVLIWIPASWQAIFLVVCVFMPKVGSLSGLLSAALPAALASSACLAAFHALHAAEAGPGGALFILQRLLLRALAAAALAASVLRSGLGPAEAAAALAAFALLVASEIISASRYGDPRRAWAAEGIAAGAILYFWHFGWISFGHGVSAYALVGGALLLHAFARLAARRPATRVLAGPFGRTSMCLPIGAVLLAVSKSLLGSPVLWLGANSLALLLAAGFYFWRGIEERRKRLIVLAAGIVNVALALLWRELRWTDPQFFLVPLGASVLALVELLREEIPRAWRDPLRYAGALAILVSPVFHIVEGSWIHMLTLMVAAVGIILVAIGLRVRAMLYTGAAFLVADLAAMVVRGSLHNPNVLWVAGLSLGALIICLAAACENRRETVLARARRAAAVLGQWD
jgi:hypothetical protein